MLRRLGTLILCLHTASGYLPTSNAQSSSHWLVVLNPNTSHAFAAASNANISLSNYGIRVDSTGSAAYRETGGSTVHASAIQVVGGASLITGATTSPTPTTGAAASDPFAGRLPLYLIPSVP